MANFLQSGIQNIVNWAFGGWAPRDQYDVTGDTRQAAYNQLINYYYGEHRKPLKLSGLGKDYNVITNHIKTIIDRSVSMLVGHGVEFDLPGEGDTPQDQIITKVMDANHKDILLHDLVQFGSIYGTPAVKIIPNGVQSLDGSVTFRLVALNPYNLTIYSAPDDIEKITTYVYRWTVGDVAWREVTAKQDDGTWLVTVQKFSKQTGSSWETQGEPVVWLYDFAPIAHGKNLPNAGNVYGYSDIEGVIELQDKYNEAQSNINKILALQAWAQKYVIGGKFPRIKDAHGNEYLDVGPDKALEIANEGAQVGMLQPSGDLDSSRQFANDIRRDMFDIASTVDAETVKDKVGALTNFGLRILFKNEIAKNATKQLLYGDLLLQVINRILRLSEFEGTEADPGKIIWGDPLPVNDIEDIQTLQQERAMGILSLESAAKARGYNWEDEQQRLAKEKQAAGNVGANMIKDFLAGRGQ